MNPLSFFSVISTALKIYLYLVIIVSLVTWFSKNSSIPSVVKVSNYFQRFTAPYLQFFYRFTFFRSREVDLTPLVGVLFLVVVIRVTDQLAMNQYVTAVNFLNALLAGIRVALSATILSFLFACLSRFFTLRFLGRTDTYLARLTRAVASIPMRIVTRYVSLKEAESETNYLLITIIALVILWIIFQSVQNQMVIGVPG